MIQDRIVRVILAFKRKVVTKLKKRSAKDRLKSRLYYRRNRRKILLKRKRYLAKNKAFLKTRNLYKRTKPNWLSKQKTNQPGKKSKKFKVKTIRPKKHGPVLTKKPSKPTKAKPAKPLVKRPKVYAPKRK